MKNFKHSIVAIIAVAMISSLAAAQAADMKNAKSERAMKINASAPSDSITLAKKDVTDAVKGVALETTADDITATAEAPVDESLMAAKSFYQIG